MGSLITGSDPNAATWPIICNPVSGGVGMIKPSGDVVVGVLTYPALLAMTSPDTNYINEKSANAWYRVNMAPLTLPVGARVTMVSPYVRGKKHIGNTKYSDIEVGVGDHSLPTGAIKQYANGVHGQLTTFFRGYTCASRTVNSQGKLFTQTDFNKGIYIVFGLNTAYGSLTAANGADWAQAYMRYTYDMPPIANITYPANTSTISNTSSPIVTWDYTDDFQPQSMYLVTIYQGSTLVYTSGSIASSATFHAVSANLPNGAYTVRVRVAQAWNGPGGTFWSNANAANSFTIAMLTLGTPRITATQTSEHVVITAYPDVNLLTFDSSTMDNGPMTSWSPGGCTIAANSAHVRDGSFACAMTLTATSANINTRLGIISCSAGNVFKAMAYINPLALAGRQASISISYWDSAFSLISATTGSTTSLGTNAWTRLTVANSTAPANAAFFTLQVGIVSGTIGDVYYVDDVGVWWQVDTATLPAWSRGGFFEATANLLSYSDSTVDDGNSVWQAVPSGSYVGSVMGLTSSQSYHGSSSLDLTNTLTTSSIEITLGSVVTAAFSVLPLTQYTLFCAVRSTVSRVINFGIRWYKADQTPSSTTVSYVALTPSVNVWSQLTGQVTAPVDAVYGVPYFTVANVTTTTEHHYVDAFAVYPTASYPTTMGFVRGYYPNTDTSPTLEIDYTDDGVNWRELAEEAVYPTQGSYLVSDYTVHSVSPQRTYRASLLEVENGISLNSIYSATVFANVTLQNVWMHADSDPANTSYNFKWDGGGRTQSIDALGVQTQVEGSQYPFAQFGIQSQNSIDVTLHLDTNADVTALNNIAALKSLVVFRDQRGRVMRGLMGAVKFADFVAGVGQDATFTLQLSGQQP